MNCPDCGKEIKIIATSRDDFAFCEPEETEIITESGHFFKGYMRHVCENGKANNTSENRG